MAIEEGVKVPLLRCFHEKSYDRWGGEGGEGEGWTRGGGVGEGWGVKGSVRVGLKR